MTGQHQPQAYFSRFLLLLVAVLLWTGMISSASAIGFSPSAYAAEGQSTEQLDKLLPLVGGALAAAGEGDWQDAKDHIKQANESWEQLKTGAKASAADVSSALAHATEALDQAAAKPEEAKAALSALAKAINTFVKSEKAAEEPALSGKEAAASLLPLAEKLLGSIQAGQWEQANAAYKQINDSWPPIEQSIRGENFTVYGKLETSMSMIRIALQAEPPREEDAQSNASALITLINDYKDGKISAEPSKASEELSIGDLVDKLNQASQDIKAGHYEEADGQMQSFISSWPSVEGQVQIRSAAAYQDIEIKMTDVSKYLLAATPSPDKAEAVIEQIRGQLTPMMSEAKYTAWDAGMILLREGLEAILVLAALLAYLKRTNNQSKNIWVWSGVWTGLLLSVALAVLLTTFIAEATAGSAREAMEGITGLVSVLLMLSVGNWLHKKSNLQAWNQYIDDRMGSALAKGSLWSLFIVSGLAILREGAETTIFYIGMAGSIEPVQLILGIGVTFLLLLMIGFAIIRFSARLPIRPFFLAASALIYYLVVRFLGESIHSLQVASWLPAHSSESLATLSFLGVYPTWETTIPQLVVLAVILTRIGFVQLRKLQAKGLAD
ncbi:FTR1 family protein [Paenibacillus glycanilyticus]|uniref:FTR1 family iron permease n=1 Tax=Paenibacillus glycanilyticus TaxID=126569 RepID=UPI00203E3770|nr:FTR1 family protein [Paenibacillus glycanilyticus]MCM3630927.1 FTR1 family protein [Paenibacillus glycanilyticus]